MNTREAAEMNSTTYMCDEPTPMSDEEYSVRKTLADMQSIEPVVRSVILKHLDVFDDTTSVKINHAVGEIKSATKIIREALQELLKRNSL